MEEYDWNDRSGTVIRCMMCIGKTVVSGTVFSQLVANPNVGELRIHEHDQWD